VDRLNVIVAQQFGDASLLLPEDHLTLTCVLAVPLHAWHQGHGSMLWQMDL
jgi:hypothetical protein